MRLSRLPLLRGKKMHGQRMQGAGQFFSQCPVYRLMAPNRILICKSLTHQDQFEMTVRGRPCVHVTLIVQLQMCGREALAQFFPDIVFYLHGSPFTVFHFSDGLSGDQPGHLHRAALQWPLLTDPYFIPDITEQYMTIGWYPGHMHKARKDITKALARTDAVIEILDARLPWSSANPMLDRVIDRTPRLRLLNKEDLADPAATDAWIAHYQRQQPDNAVIAIDRQDVESLRDLPRECRQRFPARSQRRYAVMIVGIPNVGKSTLLNIMLDRKIARVGNEPAVTKNRQEYRLDDGIMLVDTPGLLWPRIEHPASAYRLAASGAIRNTAFEFEDIGVWAVLDLARRYPALLEARYGLSPADVQVDEDTAPLLLEAIGQRRGCLKRGGVDLNRAAEILLGDLRSGRLGRITLELPEDIPPEVEADDSEETA